jgi:flagellar biosynthesis/type III secretory pathway M-ring protein FliF/YscJ
MRSYNLPHPDDAASFDLLSRIKRREEHYRTKILNKLADIPGVQVAVTVDLDTSKRVTQNIKHDPPQAKVETTDTAEHTSTAQAAEPGVQANVAQALTAGGPGQSQTTEKSSVEMFAPQLSRTETIEQLPFTTKSVTAAVGIPRSFIVGVYKALRPDVTGEPADDDPEFQAVRDAQVERVRSSVEKIVMATDPRAVEVDVYPDMEWTAEGGEWRLAPTGVALSHEAGESFDTASLVRSYGPQVGLGTLALVSLFMMMRVVRQSAANTGAGRRRVRDAEQAQEDEPVLRVGPQAVGQAELSEGLLTGKEVDSTTLRYQELAQEVSRMVEEDPAGTAELIRRWAEDT